MNRVGGSAVTALAIATALAAFALGGGVSASAAPPQRPPVASQATPTGSGLQALPADEASPALAGAPLLGRASAAPGLVSGLPSITNGSAQPVADPYFAAASGGLLGTDPYWSEYSDNGSSYTISDYYHTLPGGWASTPGDNYTADLCGYENCAEDAVISQAFTLPYGVTGATLSFDLASYCPVGTCTGSSTSSTNMVFVGVEDTVSDDYFADGYYATVPLGHFITPPDAEQLTASNVLAFVQENAGATVVVYAKASTASTDGTEFFVTGMLLTLTESVAPAPTSVTATSTASGSAQVSWLEPTSAVTGRQVTAYAVTTYNDAGVQVGTIQMVSPGNVSSTAVTGLANGTPAYFSVAAENSVGNSAAVESNSVTPLSGATPGAAETAGSPSQYLLPNSDGTTWQVMDESNLAFTITPSSSENVLLSANADLWTFNAGYNQDIGIQVTPGAGSPLVAAWKESGGFAGTFSPNAAFVETVYPMSAGTTYTVQIVWKTNKAAIGATIAAGAGPIGSSFSPTRLTADVLPAGYQSVVSTQQYSSVNSNGSTWSELDATHLVTTAFAPSSPESVVVSGNADLWTANAGYNQDLGIEVSVNGATPVLVAWKESGGFAGTFSPNAAFVQAVYPMTAGNSYVFSLWWKANKPTNGTIFVGAGPIGSAYSPTRLTVYPLPTNSAPDQWATAVSTQQYSSVNSNGSTWAEMDPTNLATPAIAIGSGGTVETVLVSGNADLWTANSGYNQDVGIEVSVNGATPVLVAWKESGGFAGTYSPNAAFVQAVYTMEPGNSYVFSLWWKANRPANATIYVGAGPIGSAFSPTRLTVVPQL
jgi:hypothetical protein